MRKVLFSFILALTASCYAQTEVNQFLSGANEGITYYLPETEVGITLKATCIKKSPGEFSRYAERYLRVKDAIKEANSHWELSGAEIATTGKPSADKMYTVKLNGSSASNLALDAHGIIAAINAPIPQSKENTAVSAATSRKNTDAGQYMTEEMLQASSTAKLAELTAKEIYAIRESKLALTRGQAENMPKDGQAMQLMLAELDKQERALTELFTGYTDTLYYRYDYEIIPSSDCDTTKAVLFRFSHKLGVLDKENLAGEPVYYDIKNLKTVEQPTADEVATDKKVIKTAESKLVKLGALIYRLCKARICSCMASRTVLFNNYNERITVTVGSDRNDMLIIAACFSLEPKLLS